GELQRTAGTPGRGELGEPLDQYHRIDDAAGADHTLLAAQDPGRDMPDLVRLAVGHDRVACIRPAVVAADEIGMLGEQVDDLALALVSPLRADDDGGRHQGPCCAQWDETDARAKPVHPLRRHPTSGCLGAPTTTVAGTSEKSAAPGGGMLAAPPLPQRRCHLDPVGAGRNPDVGVELGRGEGDDLGDLERAARPHWADADGVAGERARDRLDGDRAFVLGDRGSYQSGDVISTWTSRPARTARIRWPRGHSVQPRLWASPSFPRTTEGCSSPKPRPRLSQAWQTTAKSVAEPRRTIVCSNNLGHLPIIRPPLPGLRTLRSASGTRA